jgi:hypothetical protein
MGSTTRQKIAPEPLPLGSGSDGAGARHRGDPMATCTLSVRTYPVADCRVRGCTPTVQTVEGNYFFEDQTITLLDSPE